LKNLRGFGKNYFTLSAITAYSTAKKLRDREVVYSCGGMVKATPRESEDDPPPDELCLEAELPCAQQIKPCHCNCIFKRRAKLAYGIYQFIPRCPYYCTYFAFRRTGVHPPLFA
jgi:hypothetical protein